MFNDYLRFRDVYFLDEAKINSLYSQLIGNIESVSTQRGRERSVSFSTKVSKIISWILTGGLEASVDVGRTQTKNETIVYKRDLVDKFLEVVRKINEDEYKDIFYLADHYLKDQDSTVAIGKGVFISLDSDDRKLPQELVNIKMPIDQKEGSLILFSGEIADDDSRLEKFGKIPHDSVEKAKIDLRKSLIMRDNRGTDVTKIYSKRAFIILKSNSELDIFGLRYSYNRNIYFLGNVVKFEGNYFIQPYALWGERDIP